ncbi:MAG: DUF5011 domain-containing protein [Clostridiales Family XIII bacterium]|jgi:fimbrial isopeptide formation D2 family protein|nr:DUF5011 domain-containing protein [Clostridiales Family XIII bacterium]
MNRLEMKGKFSLLGKAVALFLTLAITMTMVVPYSIFGDDPSTEGGEQAASEEGVTPAEGEEAPPVEAPAVHTVTFVLPEGVTLEGGATTWTVQVEDYSTVPVEQIPQIVAPEGYTFKGWSLEADNPDAVFYGASAVPLFPVTADITYYGGLIEGTAEEEEVNITPLSVVVIAPGIVTVDNWDDLRQAMADTSVNEIRFTQNITRTSSTASSNDLPEISRSLTINGMGYTLDFRPGGANTTVNRPGILIKNSASGTLTVQNMTVVRSNGGDDAFVEAGDITYDSQSASAGPNWTVNFINVQSGTGTLAPSAGLILAPAAKVQIMGTVSWDSSTVTGTTNDTAINANQIFFPGTAPDGTPTVAHIKSIRRTIQSAVAAKRNIIQVTDGAKVYLEGTGTANTQVVWMQPGTSSGSTAEFIVSGEGTILDIRGQGQGTGDDGGTTTLLANAGGFNITGGAKVNIVSAHENTGMPAMIQQIDGGNFLVDGVGTELNVESYGANNNHGATIRIRLVGNQTFTVSNQAKLNVIKYGRTNSYSPAALRFGSGANNSFYVSSGGVVTIRNYGNATVATSSTEERNGGVEFDANNFTFDVSGYRSAIQIIADKGAAVSGGSRTGGKIVVGQGAVFLADGNINSSTEGIFSAGNNFSFSADRPLYYDFTNYHPGGGRVFEIAGSNNTFTSNFSDLAVWGNGQNGKPYNPVSGNPYLSWSNITYSLSGTNFSNLTNSSDSTFNTGTSSFGPNGMQPYTRISGNNAPPEIQDLLDVTNADKYVRATGIVAEGLNFAGRPLWTGEVYGRMLHTFANGTTEEVHAVSINPDNVWEKETGTPIAGVLRYSKGSFLTPGDKYKVTSAWRGASDDPTANTNHMASASDITTEEVTVIDVTPPNPATITDPLSTYFVGRSTPITGTYPANEAYNSEEAVKVYAVLVPNGQTPGTQAPISDGSGVVYGTLTPNGSGGGTFSYTVPSSVTLNKGDRIYIVLEDSNGNKNPLVATNYHDATFAAAPYVTVSEGAHDFDKFIIDANGNATKKIVISDVKQDITFRIQATFPADMSYITTVTAIDDLGQGLKLKDNALSNVTVRVAGGTTPAPDSITYVDKKVIVTWTTPAKVAQLANKQITIDVVANLDLTSPLGASVSNHAELYLNNEKDEVPTDPEVEVMGKISGVLFNDDDKNGEKNGSEGASGLSGLTVELYDSSNTKVATTTSAVDGSYAFTGLTPGAYTVKAPAVSNKGYTKKIPASDRTAGKVYNDAGNTGYTDSVTIDRDQVGLELEKVLNAGYTSPTMPDPNDPDAFKKDLVKVGSKSTNGPITDSTAVLTYDIDFKVPSNTAGYNSLVILDIMDPGLELATTNVDENVTITAKKGLSTITVTGTATYYDGTGADAGKKIVSYKLADNTDFTALEGATLTLTVKAKIVKVNNAWPTKVVNTGRLIVNNDTSDPPTAGPNEESNTGRIYGTAFVDADYDGVYDTGEVPISGLAVQLLDASGNATGSAVNTAVDGSYYFDVPAGTYGVKFAVPSGTMGRTTKPYNGKITGITITLGTEAEQTKQVDSGYNNPKDDVIDELEGSFNKKVKDPTSGNYVSTRTVSNFDEVLEYKIAFNIPSNLSGFYKIEIRDLMDAGLALMENPTEGWNVKVYAGTTEIPLTAAQKVQSGTSATFTFDADAIEQYLADLPQGTEVYMIVKAKLVKQGTAWPTKAVNRGRLLVNANPDYNTPDVTLTVAGLGPVITFTEAPLMVTQTATSQIMTQAELKAKMTVIDDVDGDLLAQTTATVAGGASIDKLNINVYKVTYTVKDSNDNQTTATRAVVVTDGRYIVDKDDNGGIIIGARNYVMKSAQVDGTESQARSASYAEAYDIDGDPLTVKWTGAPSGYTAAPAAGEYPIRWTVEGYTTYKQIKAIITNATEVDPGTKDSQYALVASDFMRRKSEAEAMLSNLSPALISAAQAQVIKLVDVAPDKAARVVNNNGFSATAATYPIQFGAEGLSDTALRVIIKGVVYNGTPAALAVQTPYEISQGAVWNDTVAKQGITVLDPDDPTLTVDAVTYAAVNPVNPAVPGLYPIHYSVTDADDNTSEADRILVVNDGSYVLGTGRILQAFSFVTKASDVTSNITSEILTRSGARLYNGTTGAQVDATSVGSAGGYSSAVGSYSIVINGVDTPSGTITKNITGKVVDAEVIKQGPDSPAVGETDKYYVYGNNIGDDPDEYLRPSEAQALDTDAKILAALDAHADKVSPTGTITDAGAKVVSVTPQTPGKSLANGDVGLYTVRVSDADGKTTAEMIIRVGNGGEPVLTVPQPLKIDATTAPGVVPRDDLMDGVSATDPEEGDITDQVVINPDSAGNEVLPTIPANEPGIYPVEYYVSDEDGNESLVKTAVVVDDGSFVYDDQYVLSARSFLIGVSKVTPGQASSQIISSSGAMAAKIDGTPATPVVKESAGYTNVKGDYKPQITIDGHTSLVKEITARVYDDSDGPGGQEGENGIKYSILASNIRINLTDAASIAAMSDPGYSAEFITRSAAKSYLRADSSLPQAGTPQLVGAVTKVSGGTDFKAGGFTEGDVYQATFQVAEEPATQITISVLVSDATDPVLNVPASKTVAIGATFPEGAENDATPSYMQGVSATDAEDGTITDRITHDTPVDTSTTAAIRVTYRVEDDDHNVVTKSGVVLVGDWTVVSGYGITANNFSKKYEEVIDANEAEAIAFAQAKAVDLRQTLPNGDPNPNFGEEVPVKVADDGGYYSRTVGENSIKFAVVAEPAATKTILGKIDSGTGPTITFTQDPLIVQQTATSHILTQDELKANMTVTDLQDGNLIASTSAIPVGGQIDARNINVYTVDYSVTDSHGNTQPARRAVVVTDGRYVIEDEDGDGKNDIIIGARNFVLKSSQVDGSESQVRSASYAEAYVATGAQAGTSLSVKLKAMPAGYVANAPAGNYDFTWIVTGHTTEKTITGIITNATEVDPGTKDSQYALIASDFSVLLPKATEMINSGNLSAALITEAKAEVIPLVPTASAKSARVVNNGGFAASAATYNIQFGAEGLSDSELRVIIKGVVRTKPAPVLDVTSPVEVPQNGTFNPMTGVTATDSEEGDISTKVAITGDVVTTVPGLYKLEYSVTDNGGSTTSTTRVVVVNDGSYVLGNGRILQAFSFVTKLSDVPAADAQLNSDILTNADVRLYDGRTAAPVDAFSVGNNGGYKKQTGTYTITINGVDTPAGTITKNITGKVVDAEVIKQGPDNPDPEKTDRYFVYGNNLSGDDGLRPSEAQQLDTDAKILAALDAHADKVAPGGAISDAGVKIVSITPATPGNVLADGDLGVYTIVVSDLDGTTTISLTVNVSQGGSPELTVPQPLFIPVSDEAGNLTKDDLMDGVSATDPEEGDVTDDVIINPDGSKNEVLPTIPANEPGIYEVTYFIEDADGNQDQVTTAVVVDDGSFVYDDEYVLSARSFLIGVSEVTPSNAANQILDKSDAMAAHVDGTPATPVVKETAGYTNIKGEYQPIITISGHTSLEKGILAKVYDDSDGPGGQEGENGVKYSILASNIRINLIDAAAIAGYSDANYKSEFITRSAAKSYLRATANLLQGGTIELVGDVTKKGSGTSFKAGSFTEGDVYEATFRVAEEPATYITIDVLVSNATNAVLTVPEAKNVSVGAIFPEGASEDTTPSYMQGVVATDAEDGTITDKVTHDTPVDTSTTSASLVTYEVEDNDYNVTTKGGMVFVGDWFITSGYAIVAESFTVDITDVVSWNEAEAIALAKAEAYDVRATLDDGVTPNPNFGKKVPVKVANDGGFYNRAPGEFDITFAVTEKPEVAKTITGTVDSGSNAEITFGKDPLIVTQTAVSHILTQDELKEGMSVIDPEDGDLLASTTAIPVGGQIDAHNIGVYTVNYSVTDSHGNTTNGKRAVVVTDGRYIIEDEDGDGVNDIIIGARNFVMKSAQVDGSESQVRSASYAEAYVAAGPNAGDILQVKLVTMPAGYVAHAPAGDYTFTWTATGHTTTKSIVGTITNADEVDPGTKDSQYALIGYNFTKTTAEVRTMLNSGNVSGAIITAAKAEVVKLVPGVPDKNPVVTDNGGFTDTSATYNITFGAEGLPASELRITIKALVTSNPLPVLAVTTPYEVQEGGTFDPTDGVTAYVPNDPSFGVDDVEITGGDVPTTIPGIYVVKYSLTDDDDVTVEAQRVVVVNDGSYEVGNGRILQAFSFVTKLEDVSSNTAYLDTEILSNAAAKLYDGTTAALVDALSVLNRGGYTKAVGSYDITLSGVDTPSGTITKSVTGKVVDAEVIKQGPDTPVLGDTDKYYVYGNNIGDDPDEYLRPSEAQALDTPEKILDALGVHADKVLPTGEIEDAGAKVVSITPVTPGKSFEDGDVGQYKIKVSDEDGTTVIELTVNVGEGGQPILTVPQPLVIPVSDEEGNLTKDELMDGVSATDPEVGDITDQVIINPDENKNENIPNIPGDEPGIYQVTYFVEDEDGNQAEVTTAVVVDDGSVVYDNDYILSARSFLIGVSEVTPSQAREQILEKSQAMAARVDGTPATPIVLETAGYTNVKGEYQPVISISGHTSLTKGILVKVYDDSSGEGGQEGENGTKYAILGANIRINLTDAQAIAGYGDPAYANEFLSRSAVKSYDRTTTNLLQAGTPALSGDVVKQGSGESFKAGNFNEGDVYLATYIVTEEPATSITVTVLVSNAHPPVIDVPEEKTVSLGAIFPEGAQNDTTPSYMQGVVATDAEDGTITDKVTHDTPVDTSVTSAAFVTYSVTDNDYNTTTTGGVVLVGDNWTVVSGYAISAEDFSMKLYDVQGTEAEVITKSNAMAIDLRRTLDNGDPNPEFGKPVAVVVKSDGGYYQKKPGKFPITLAISGKPDITYPITASVDNGEAPSITFTQEPLIIQQTAASQLATSAELRAEVTATDQEDGNITNSITATPVTPIDKHNIGVYKVNYSVTDSNGNKTTAQRAVVVTDGRYVIKDEDGDGKNDVIIGARSFVVAQQNVNGTESQVRSLSYAEAYDVKGNALEVKLESMPAGYGKQPSAKDYGFTWTVPGHTATKSITGTVTAATVVDPGTKDGQYALIAYDFIATTSEAAEIAKSNKNFISKSKAQIIKLVPSAPDREVRVVNKGGFTAYDDAGNPVTGSYDVQFGAVGLADNDLKAVIKATVTIGQAPILTVPTPVETPVGQPYDDSDVSAYDPEDGDITDQIVKTGDIDYSTPGIYPIEYSITDDDGNEVTGTRVVVVNDGRYTIGSGRILEASSFVTNLADIPTDADQLATDVITKSNAKVYDGATGEELDGVYIEDLDGYSAKVGQYEPVIAAADLPAPSGVSTLAYPDPVTKTVNAEIVDADVTSGPTGVDPSDATYVYGNSITLTQAEAQALNTNAKVLEALNAGARRAHADGSLTDPGVKIKAMDPALSALSAGTVGLYHITLTDGEDRVEKEVTINVTATGDEPPTLDVTKPIVIPVGEEASGEDLMDGVTATDPETGDITDQVKINDEDPADVTIDTTEPGVVEVTYSVTDDAGNEIEEKAVVIIDDGSFVYDENYILSAYSFMIGKSEVTPSQAGKQIVEKSNARAWKMDGTELSASTAETAGYKNVVGEYQPKIVVAGHPEVSKIITAKVVDDSDGEGGTIPANGTEYSVSANNFRLNLTDAKSLSYLRSFSSEFVDRAGAKTYLRTDKNLPVMGTAELVGQVVRKTDGKDFWDGEFNEGDVYLATFKPSGEDGPTTTIEVLVSNGTAPKLYAPVLTEVALGSVWGEGQYMNGVYATDNEDDGEVLSASITHNNTVNTAVRGVYTITYTVTDSDHNTVTRKAAVLVGFTPNDDYATYAEDFARPLSSISGTAAEAISLAKATAYYVADPNNPKFGQSVPVVVANAGGYSKAAGVFTITFAVQEKQTVTFKATATISDDTPAPPIYIPVPGPTIIVPTTNTVTNNVITETIVTETAIVTEPAVRIDDPEPPLESGGVWSLLDLVFALFSVVIMLMLIVSAVRRGKEENAIREVGVVRKRSSRDLIGIALATLAALIAVPVLLLTSNFKGDMALLGTYTWVMAILAIISVAGALISLHSDKKEWEQV